MDYNMGFALTFKCIICYDFVMGINIFYRDSIYDTWWGKKIDWKKLQQKI
jgi:hypothetical protein